MTQISILIQTNASGYLASSPELNGYQVQGDLDSVMDDIKAKLKAHLAPSEVNAGNSVETDTPISIAAFAHKPIGEMTDAERAQLQALQSQLRSYWTGGDWKSAKEAIARAHTRYAGQIFSDSAELIREDRER